MDETVCSFAFLSPYPSSFSLLPFPRSPHTPVLLCCCALYSATTESSGSNTSLFSHSDPSRSCRRSTPYPFLPTRHFNRTEIKSGENSDTRTKPLALANGHGRRMTAAPERKPVTMPVGDKQAAVHDRCKFVTASLLKRPRNGRFTSEFTVRRF
jgi:hypothetical protein